LRNEVGLPVRAVQGSGRRERNERQKGRESESESGSQPVTREKKTKRANKIRNMFERELALDGLGRGERNERERERANQVRNLERKDRERANNLFERELAVLLLGEPLFEVAHLRGITGVSL
jgi:hypothetical protein